MRVCEQCLRQLPSLGAVPEMVEGSDDDFIDLAREPDFCLAAMVVRPSLREIVADGRVETIEPRVMQAFVALARAKGNVVSRDTLIALCWRGRVVGDDAINRCIAKLRHVAERPDGAPFTVETVPRVGYRLKLAEPAVPAAAQRMELPPKMHAVYAPLATGAAESILSIAATMPRARERPQRRIALALSALCAVAVAAAVWYARPGHRGIGNSEMLFGTALADVHPAVSPDGTTIANSAGVDANIVTVAGGHPDAKAALQARLKGAGNDLRLFELLRHMQ